MARTNRFELLPESHLRLGGHPERAIVSRRRALPYPHLSHDLWRSEGRRDSNRRKQREQRNRARLLCSLRYHLFKCLEGGRPDDVAISARGGAEGGGERLTFRDVRVSA